MAQAPGRSDRDGITIIELMQMFPTDDAARKWLEAHVWPDGRHCPHCGSENTAENKGKSESRPYHCRDCSQHFSVRIGTIMEGSRLSFQKWVFAIYLHMTSLKGVSSMKLHRDLGITQKTAWFMLQRIREAFKATTTNRHWADLSKSMNRSSVDCARTSRTRSGKRQKAVARST